MSIEVVVRDGRVGRNPAEITDEGGPVLVSFQSDRPFDVGEKITLPDGTTVEIIGVKEQMSTAGWQQTLFISDVFEQPGG